MHAVTTLLNRLVQWLQRTRIWTRFSLDLGDLSLDDRDIYLDLASGRD